MKLLLLHDNDTHELLTVPRLSASDIALMLRCPPSEHPEKWGPSRTLAPPDAIAAERILRLLGAYDKSELPAAIPDTAEIPG